MIDTESEAVRVLIQTGLDATKQAAPPAAKKPHRSAAKWGRLKTCPSWGGFAARRAACHPSL
jgi:hypothetical protein